MCIIHVMVLSSVGFSQRKPAVVANVVTPFWRPGHRCAFLRGKGAGGSAITLQYQILGVQNNLSVYIRFWLILELTFYQHLLPTQPHTSLHHLICEMGIPVWIISRYQRVNMLSCNSGGMSVISEGLVTQALTKLVRESLSFPALHQGLMPHPLAHELQH